MNNARTGSLLIGAYYEDENALKLSLYSMSPEKTLDTMIKLVNFADNVETYYKQTLQPKFPDVAIHAGPGSGEVHRCLHIAFL